MHVSPAMEQWLSQNYPRPRVDPEWVEQCYTWLVQEENISPETQLDKIKQEMRTQINLSDLKDSMLPGTGLSTQFVNSEFSSTLDGPPILVQITSITDIGVSAFNLNQTRIAREERLHAGAVEDGQDGDEEVDGEGPVPKYQRGMLKFSLSDGALTLQAIEHRPLTGLRLGETKLGTKLRLKHPLIRRGIAFLDPKSVEVVGGSTEEIEENQSFAFKRSLFRRLGLPDAEPDPPRPPLVRIDLPPPPASPPRTIVTLRGPDSNSQTPLETRKRRVPDPQPEASSTTSPFFSAAPPSPEIQMKLSPRKGPSVLQASEVAQDRSSTSQSGQKEDLDDEYSFDDFNLDSDGLEELNRAEEAAMAAISRTQSQSQNIIIEIDDDEDMEKENEPLPRPRKKRQVLSPSIHVVDISDSD